MGKYRGMDTGEGWIQRRFAGLERRLEELAAARRLESSVITKSGLRIAEDGWVWVSGTGRVISSVADAISHLADGRLWTETPIDPADPLGGGTVPRTMMQPTGWAIYASLANWVAATADSDGTLRLWSTASKVLIPHLTTSASANTVIDGFGIITRSTSSRRYKREIKDAVVDPAAVLRMRGRTWRDKAQVDDDPETTDRYVGFIAEELHDLGLHDFIVYDEDGAPEAIAYDRLSVALLAVLKDQDQRLRVLEQKAKVKRA